MANADSTATKLQPVTDAVLRSLDSRASTETVRAKPVRSAAVPVPMRRRSGVFVSVDRGDSPKLVDARRDAYAGLERLDRAELDETDEG